MAAKLIQGGLYLGDKLRMSCGDVSEKRARGQGEAGIAAACVLKGLQGTKQRIGDGHLASVLIETTEIMEPTGEDEWKNARRLAGFEKIH